MELRYHWGKVAEQGCRPHDQHGTLLRDQAAAEIQNQAGSSEGRVLWAHCIPFRIKDLLKPNFFAIPTPFIELNI